MTLIRFASFIASVVLASTGFAAQETAIVSPSGNVRAVITTRASKPTYRLELISGAQVSIVLRDAPLGVKFKEAEFTTLRFVSVSDEKTIEEKYVMTTGKRRECHLRANARTLRFKNKAGLNLEVDFRVSDDGLAFRYRLPGAKSETVNFQQEFTAFALPRDARVWCSPSDKATMYAPGYETYYVNGLAPSASTNGVGWSFPLLFHSANANAWALITEASVTENFCATRLSNDPRNGVYGISLPDPLEGNATGDIQPRSKLPLEMPWRVVITGRTLATIVESTLVTDVSDPCRLSSVDWVKPGRVAWSWWSDNPSPRYASKQKQFIDLAAEMGWEYVLVDANWTIMQEGNIQEILNYGHAKNIGVLLWYNSGGPHNVVTEKPRDTLTYDSVRQFELKMLREWGVKGIKVDFFQSDKQNVIEVYRGILRDSAEQQIMMNFHGCTLPRGWQRTFPHLMSMEAVRGAECYIFDAQYPKQAPVQNTILPFTRNVVGSMDFTPVAFSDNKYPHLTTSAHELALAVLFESGWLHFADKPEAYRSLPDQPKQFLKEVPVTWDEVRFVNGFPGEYAVLARRKAKTWYVAGVNGQDAAREVTVNLTSFLGIGAFDVLQIGDGSEPRSFASSVHRISSNKPIALRLAPRGGFVLVCKPAP